MLGFFKNKVSNLLRLVWFRKEEVSWHSIFVSQLAQLIDCKIYVELGVYHGETLSHVEPFSSKLYAVDISEIFLEKLNLSEKVLKVHGDSSSISKILKSNGEKIDLLFIDADHDKLSVIKDFRQLEPLVAQNGIVCFDDTFPMDERYLDPGYCGTAWAAIPELASEFSHWSFITIPRHPGLTLACRNFIQPDFTRIHS